MNVELLPVPKVMCPYIPVCSGGGVAVGGCGVGGVSGGVESVMREKGEDGGTGCGSDTVISVGTEYEEVTRVGAGGTCKCTVGGVAV